MQPGTTKLKQRKRAGAAEGRRRVIIEGVRPEIDCGRFPIKRTVGERVAVEADVFTDGHDSVACRLLWKHRSGRAWTETAMEPLGNDRWRASFPVDQLGRYQYTVEGWLDPYYTWRHDLIKRVAAGQDVSVDLLIGATLLEAAASRARGRDRQSLERAVETLRSDRPIASRTAAALDEALEARARRYPNRDHGALYGKVLEVVVDPERAGFSTWYELFPRSASPEPGRHGTLRDVEARLPYVKELGFDVLYLPPIHPIGETKRKGPNNLPEGRPGDPGSPWGIGSRHGGHKSVHPELGTVEDVRRLADSARAMGIELALDIAFQAAPDHPYVNEHPEWFRSRPDGTIQYAENPPKKYQDIYPLDFETTDPEGLWNALKGVFDHWIGEGIRIFRVDNPHTKSFPFWEWVIPELRSEHPDLILLAEAFTRPAVMNRLAKVGFNQSYTYFAWRSTKWELTQYMSDLEQVSSYFRPAFWPNTPDILTEELQTGGRAAFISRYVLAATLSSVCGIYGPAFELMERRPLHEGSEEYRSSEKYQIRHWDLERTDSLAPLLTQVNKARKAHPALQRPAGLVFHPTDNDMILSYSKRNGDDVVLMVVSLDPHHTQSGWVTLDLDALGVDPSQRFTMHDALTDRRYQWDGQHNFVQLDPAGIPAHIFTVRGQTRTEEGFDYFV